jgi:two-component system LytT family sensor kinase
LGRWTGGDAQSGGHYQPVKQDDSVLNIDSSQTLKTVVNAVYINRTYQFWLMQLIGWSGLCVVTFFSLTLWYNAVQWPYISHTILQSVLGMILSLPLRASYLALWEKRIPWRMGLSLIVVTVVSLVWTVLRIITFMWITSEEGIWTDFGGWYFSSFLVYLCWTALYYGSKYYYQAQVEHRNRLEAIAAVKEEQLKRLSAEADAKNSQLGMLQYQLNPHFLFNTLNTISALVKFEENEKAHKMITQLGHFLRYSLDNDPALKISMEQEVAALMLYLDIERTRFGERLTLQFDVDEAAKRAQVPSLLLQPLAENSIKYAIAANENGGTIKLKATVQGGDLQIELTDTGPGTVSNRPAPRTGRRVGLHNTLQRLKTLYNDAYLFDINLHPSGGLKINIRIPYDPV